VLAAYLERWPQVRRERERRERASRTHRRASLELAERHCWKGTD
jgi:3-oxoacyl-[acyl-carrier-protein] synthase II